MKRIPAVLSMLCLIALMLVACGGAEKVAPAFTHTSQSRDNSLPTSTIDESTGEGFTSSLTTNQEQSQSINEESSAGITQIPDTITWDDMPIYPGARPTSGASGELKAEGIYQGMQTYETDDSFDNVVAFYQTQMPSNGWHEVKLDRNKDIDLWSGEYSKNNEQGIITLSCYGKETTILLMKQRLNFTTTD